MKPTLYLLVFALLLALKGFSQNCASNFAASPGGLVETCSTTGAAGPYAIFVTDINDTTLVFQGLWEESSALDTAAVNCANMTFEIVRQRLNANFDIEATGMLNTPTVSITYSIYYTGDSNAVDVCTGVYSVNGVGLPSPALPQLEVFPNPTDAYVQLRLSGVWSDAPWTYTLVDLQGRTVAQGQLGESLATELDVRGYAKGMYRILLHNPAGQVISRNLVVQ